MRRRQLITLLGAAAAAWPLAARAQQAGKLPTIGFLGTATASGWSTWTTSFVARLRELGWIEGHTIAIEYRWAEGRNDRYAEIVAEFVRLKVDVIVTTGAAVVAAKRATSVTPILFAIATDPVGGGLVASLARPGGNVTGLSSQTTDIVSKRIELFREVVPNLQELAVLANVGYPSAVLEVDQVEATAVTLGVKILPLEIRQTDDIAPAFEKLKGGIQGLYVVIDPLTTSHRVSINTLALVARLPTIHGIRENVQAGGLISYGPNYSESFRRTADFVDKILRGTKPGDIPVEQPTKFELVLNLTTAKALGLTIPEAFLLRADEVIE